MINKHKQNYNKNRKIEHNRCYFENKKNLDLILQSSFFHPGKFKYN